MSDKIEIQPQEWAIGQAVIASYAAGDTVQNYRNTFLGAFATMLSAEQAWAASSLTLEDPAKIAEYAPHMVGGHHAEALKLGMDDPAAVAYLACSGAVRASLVPGSGWNQVKPNTIPGVPMPDWFPPIGDLGSLPTVAVIVGLSGVSGIAAAAWAYTVERDAQLAQSVAQMQVAAKAYADDVKIKIAAKKAGVPGIVIPKAPPGVEALAKQELRWKYWQLAAGVVLGAVAGMGIYHATRAVQSPVTVVANPAPRRRRRRVSTKKTTTKRNPSKKSSTKKRATKKTPTRRSNPAKKTKREEALAELRRIGRGSRGRKSFKEDGVQIIYWSRYEDSARAVARLVKATGGDVFSVTNIGKGKGWRVVFQMKDIPDDSYVLGKMSKREVDQWRADNAARRARKRNPSKKTATKKRATKKRATKKATTKRNPSKKTAAKKRATKKKNPCGSGPKATFIRKQRRKGRSPAQAEADWKAKRRLAQMKKGKSPKGRRAA